MFLFVMVSSKFHYLNSFETMLYTVLAKQRGDKEKERGGMEGRAQVLCWQYN